MSALRPDAGYEIVRYGPELKGQIAELQRHLWQGDVATNTAYLEWKYEQNPYFQEPLIYLGVTDGRVVGMRGVFGSAWEIGPESSVVVVPSVDDLVIAPDHRTRGLFARIMRVVVSDLAERGHPYSFSLSPGPTTVVGSLAGGWRAIGSMSAAHRPVRWVARVRRLSERLAKVPLLWRYAGAIPFPRPPFARLDRRLGRAARGAVPVRVESAPRVQAMADLVRRLGHDGRIRHVRDERYLAWRFRNPLHEYRFLFCGDDRLDGYLVLQGFRPNERRGVNIVDWEATTPRIRAALLRAAVAWGRFREIGTWTAMLSEEGRALLRRERFVPVDQGPLARYVPSVLVRATRAGDRSDPILSGTRLLDPANWDMRMLYSMAG